MKGLHMQISLMLVMTIGVVITRAEVISDCSLGYRDLPLEHEYEHPEDTVVPPYFSPGFWSPEGIGAYDPKCALRLYQENLDLDQDGQMDTLRILRTYADSAHIETSLQTIFGNATKKSLYQVFQSFEVDEVLGDVLSGVHRQGSILHLSLNRGTYVRYAESSSGGGLTLRFQNQSWEIIGSDVERTFLCNEYDGASNTGANESHSYNLSTGTLIHKVEGVQCYPPLSKKECKKQLSQCEQADEYDCNSVRMACSQEPKPKSYTQKTRFKKGALPLSLQNLSRIGEL